MDFSKALLPDEQAPAADKDLAGGDITNLPGGDNTRPRAGAGLADPADTSKSQNPNIQQAGDAPGADSPTQQQIDYNAYLDKMSGGLIKDEAGFKAVLPKLSEYESIKETNKELSAKMAAAPVFADDEVRILNELKAAGASKDQIKSFQKINEYGTISEMPDREARIARMVMIDGVKPSVAEIKVDREFKLGDESISDEEREILNDDLRVAANNDRKELEKFKAQVSNATQLPPEEVQLKQQADLLAHQAKVKPYVSEVMKAVPNLGAFDLSAGKDPGDVVKYEIPIDDNIRQELGQYVENYYIDGLTEVTPENTRLAMNYARAEYFRTHAAEVLQSAFMHGVSVTTEKLVNKYENRSGLKQPGEKPLVGGENAAAETAQFMSNVANRKT